MADNSKPSFLKEVDRHCKSNNLLHRTLEISTENLIVRRGQSFKLTVTLTEAFNSQVYPFVVCSMTGSPDNVSEERGTMSFCAIPDIVERSPKAKAVWKVELDTKSSTALGLLSLTLTPPADTPIGQYVIIGKYREEEFLLAMPMVLFNPWCKDDWVFLSDEDQRKEYVLNEEGIVFKGSDDYIFPMEWDFGQFEEDMVAICTKLLDLNHKHKLDPADDVSARCNPIYVSRVISAMINSEDDRGVLQGRWGAPYTGGVIPSHWSSSHTILSQWLKYDCYPVKYGQCWVFAAVMCAVMRFLGIPCRVVTNYSSAHDTNGNLVIDTYHADYGVREKTSHDSIWNFHVWVEGWMRRPDLDESGEYDGWQVLDPTPQEKSDKVYCCGPASVKAIRKGQTDVKYDIPFVFAEVNADSIDWLMKKDGTKVKIYSDTKGVGHNISTKDVGTDKRVNITNTYKHKEGSDEERNAFKYACSHDYSVGFYDVPPPSSSSDEEEVEKPVPVVTEVQENETTEETRAPLPPVRLDFKEVSEMIKGKDVKLNLIMHSKSTVDRSLSALINVQCMKYNGTPVETIHHDERKEMLLYGKELVVPIEIPFSVYWKPMLDCSSLKVSAVVCDKDKEESAYLAELDVVLADPPFNVVVLTEARQYRELRGEVLFTNPVNETLTNCTMTFSGNGFFKEEEKYDLPDLKPKTRVRIQFSMVPFKAGQKKILADFDCSHFRDIKSHCTVDVKDLYASY